ncbi:RloB family protein [Streptomyces aidingensis]|uniref:RloB-like protein n=1 Tax=Streptomyces aidingensis TaxID=910347 RepID=A0A1I1Q7F4_9ACTN|nr:RloB family protein [Streptomyces aidingensis]SFD15788.1 RloB-like protein [Streptomyces aidingensis]
MSPSQKRSQQRRGGRRRDPDAATPRGVRRSPGSYPDKSVRVIYVAAEGGRTERDYLRQVEKSYGRGDDEQGVRPFRFHYCDPGHVNGLRPEEAVLQVVAGASSPDDEKWALFDRDSLDNRDAEIPAAMRLAARKGVQVALSHPSFELWLLLHFQHFTSQEDGRDDKVKERLRGHKDAQAFREYDTGSGKRGKGLDDEHGAALHGREHTAVRNARKLVDACPHGGCAARTAATEPIGDAAPEPYGEWTARTGHAPDCDPLRRDPSTDLWRLLVSLGIGTEGSNSKGSTNRRSARDAKKVPHQGGFAQRQKAD